MRRAAAKSGSLFLLLAQRIDRTHGLGRQSVEQVRGLGHRSLDVAGELGEYRRIYKARGFAGLLEYLLG